MQPVVGFLYLIGHTAPAAKCGIEKRQRDGETDYVVGLTRAAKKRFQTLAERLVAMAARSQKQASSPPIVPQVTFSGVSRARQLTRTP